MSEKAFEITKSDLHKVFWRSMPIEISYNSERLHNMFYVYSLTPIFKKIYKDDPQGMRDALVRHMQFYNTCPQFEAIVVGIVAALEVKNVESGNTMGPTIEAVKTSLMGPTGVIGDAFFQTGGFRIISASIGASMCIAGNPYGLLLYFLFIMCQIIWFIGGVFIRALKWDRSSLKRSLTPAFCKKLQIYV